jgi:transcriptional regulator with XRE-family HTH domain
MDVMWDKEAATHFGVQLKALRISHGLTQEKFAYRAGITKNQVQLLEAARGSGKANSESHSNPTMATVFGLADAFDMSVSELFEVLGT